VTIFSILNETGDQVSEGATRCIVGGTANMHVGHEPSRVLSSSQRVLSDQSRAGCRSILYESILIDSTIACSSLRSAASDSDPCWV